VLKRLIEWLTAWEQPVRSEDRLSSNPYFRTLKSPRVWARERAFKPYTPPNQPTSVATVTIPATPKGG
jgi:hypothetical protein